MGKCTTRRLAVWAVALLASAAVSLVGADDSAPKGKSEPAELSKQLIGAWVLEGPAQQAPRLKLLTGRHWVITESDPTTGKVVWHHGGRYTLDGDTYFETVEYANESTAQLVGKTFKFKVKVEGDAYTQTAVGDDNPFTEKWKRAK